MPIGSLSHRYELGMHSGIVRSRARVRARASRPGRQLECQGGWVGG